MARLGDAAACLEKGVQRAAVEMLGLAFEETLRASVKAVVAAGYIPTEPSNAVDVMKALRNYAERLHPKTNKRHTILTAIVAAEGTRTERNRSAHPSSRFDDEAAVEELLVSASRQIPVLWDCLVEGTPPSP